MDNKYECESSSKSATIQCQGAGTGCGVMCKDGKINIGRPNHYNIRFKIRSNKGLYI